MAKKLNDCVEGDIVKVYETRGHTTAGAGYVIYKVKGVHDTNFIGVNETEKTERQVVLLEWDIAETAFLDLGEIVRGLVDDRKAWPTVYPVKTLPIGEKAPRKTAAVEDNEEPYTITVEV